MGSGGSSIARVVATKLRYRYYDWEVISQAAEEAGVSPEVFAVAAAERAPGFVERIMERLGSMTAGDEPPPTSGRPSLFVSSDDYRQFLEHVVKELGSQGQAVIVNHSGQAVLRGVPGVLKVLTYGSKAKRAARLAQIQHADPAAVLKTITEADRQRSDYFKRVYHIDWLSSQNYDLVINTDHIAPDLAADMVGAAAKEMP
jgi:cytidylate kinase